SQLTIEKSTSYANAVAADLPSTRAGVKRHCSTAVIADCKKPLVSLLFDQARTTVPLSSMATRSRTDASSPSRRADLGYFTLLRQSSGSIGRGVSMGRNCTIHDGITRAD